MNNLRTTVSALLCCVLLISTPLGIVDTASAASTVPDEQIDFCEVDSVESQSYDDTRAAAEEVMEILPRWYQDVARGNIIIIHVYDNRSPDHVRVYDNRYPDYANPKMSFLMDVGEDFELKFFLPDYRGDFAGGKAMLTVDTDCQTLNRIYASDDRGDAIVDAIWEDDITYYGDGPGADAAVVYSKSLLTGAYVMEHRQSGNLGDFVNGALAPVTKTYEELFRNYDRLFKPFEDDPARPGGQSDGR